MIWRSIFIPIIFFIFHELYWPISQNSVCRQHVLFDATGHTYILVQACLEYRFVNHHEIGSRDCRIQWKSKRNILNDEINGCVPKANITNAIYCLLRPPHTSFLCGLTPLLTFPMLYVLMRSSSSLIFSVSSDWCLQISLFHEDNEVFCQKNSHL